MESTSHTAESSDLPAQGPIQSHLIALQQNLEQSLVDREQHFKQLACEIEAKAKAAAEKVASGTAELRKVLGIADETTTQAHFGRNSTGNMDEMQGEAHADYGFNPQTPWEQSVQHHSTHRGRVAGTSRDEGAHHQSRQLGGSRDGSPTDHVRRTSLGRDRSMDRNRRGRHSHQKRRSRSRERSSRRSRSRERRSRVGRRSRSRSRSREMRSRVGRRDRSGSRSRERRSRVEEGRRRSKDRSPHHRSGRILNVNRSRDERESRRRDRSLSSSRSPRYDKAGDNPVSSIKEDLWKESRQLHEGKDQTCHTGWMKWPSLSKDGTT